MTPRRQLLYPALYRDSVATDCLQHLSAMSHFSDQEMLTNPSIQNVHLTHRKFCLWMRQLKRITFLCFQREVKSQYNVFLPNKIQLHVCQALQTCFLRLMDIVWLKMYKQASKIAQQSKALTGLLEILGFIARTHMVIQYSGLPEHQTCTWWHRYLQAKYTYMLK